MAKQVLNNGDTNLSFRTKTNENFTEVYDGKVAGPASATDNAVARYDSTTGKLVQNSTVVITDAGFVGVGDAAPDREIVISGSTGSPAIAVRHTARTASGTPHGVSISSSNNRSSIFNSDSVPLRLGVNSTTAINISSTNQVTFPEGVELGTPVSGSLVNCTGASVTVRDIDGAPSIAARTIEFTNGTVTDQGSGVARVTIAGGGGSGDAATSGTLDQFADVTQTSGATLAISASTTLNGGTHSGTNSGDNAVNSLYSGLVSNATHTGDVTGATALTLATVNSNVGQFGSATQASQVTVNAKGLVTAAANVTVTPAVGSITGLGTGVASALAVNVGSSGSPLVNGGALATPASGSLVNCTGLPATAITGTIPVARLSMTKAQLNTIVSDGDVLYVGDVSGSAVTVRDIDGTPSIAATTLEFTNGTVSDQGSGIARITISGGGGGLGEPLVMPYTAMAALEIDVTKFGNTKSITADTTFTFSNATPTAGTRTELLVTADTSARTLTFPHSYSYARNATVSTVLVPASSTVSLSFVYTGSRWEVYGDPVEATGTGVYVLATSPVLVTPALGTPSSGVLTNCTGLPTAGLVNDAVTYAKIQNVSAASRMIGRGSAGGAGDVEELSLGVGLRMSGTTVSVTRSVQLTAFDYTTDVAVGDGAAYFVVPPSMNGMNLVSCSAYVIAAGTTGTTNIQIARIRAGSAVDMLSTVMTIDSTETGTDTAATPAVINSSNDDLATHDRIRVDVDSRSTTPPKGLILVLNCEAA
jgi:hypothetical protein